MSGSKRRIVGWDSGIFIAWLTKEPRVQDEFQGLIQQAKLVEAKKIQIMTSTITLIEFLESHARSARVELEQLFQREDFELHAVNQKIAEKAHEIRNYTSTLPDGFPPLTTPDAIQLATAVYSRCEVFYTFDGKDKKDKQRGLLGLNSYFYGTHGVRIEKPSATRSQATLDL